MTTAHAKNKLKNLFDRTTSTKLMEKEEIPEGLFAHDDNCKQKRRRKKPCAKDDQHLRDMRHKAGKNLHDGVVAECSECGHQYTLDDLVVNCLNHLNAEAGSDEAGISSWTKVQRCENEDELEGKKKLEELLFLLSSPERKRNPKLSEIVTNAVRNLHGWKHAPQCFKHGCECRYRLPAKHCSKTEVEMVEEFEHWCDYLGNKSTYRKYELVPKRSEYDTFMNQYSRAMSQSKLGSNSNSQLCTNGQKAMYCSKSSPNSNSSNWHHELTPLCCACLFFCCS